ncbi:class I SAM-dependent methyltransferase [Cerasicoccus fimbriatus]|uniref:class I SAM-dependent methyltransferase n=1 Tax=Cerasicoccus fimbriatus TaxID=3014554 RepID=UPI0022B5B27C|nr:class I SAM-dependent methyltransferase [Cerasicoccus sp. TK19100]
MEYSTKVKSPSKTKCRMCHGDTFELAQIKSRDEKPDLDLVQCKDCGTITYEGDDPVFGYTSDKFIHEYWIHYAQCGAGISSMAEPLHQANCAGSFLDVGCGFGFMVDYWQTTTGASSDGMELSKYGHIGKEKLNITIHHALLGECPEVDNRYFDIVYASEVIEHVTDPKAFVMALKERLAPGGRVVLTTPSSNAVTDSEVNDTTRIAALSPYFHYFIASRKSLEDLLKAAGFAHVIVQDSGTRLFAWASDEPIELQPDYSFNWDVYLDYLDKLSQNPDRHIRSGALYRRFKDMWNLGKHEQARECFARFEQVCADEYQIDLRSFTIPSDISSFTSDSYDTHPAWLPMSLYMGAQIIEKYEKDSFTPLKMLINSYELGQMHLSNQNFRQFSQEIEHFLPVIKIRLHETLKLKAAEIEPPKEYDEPEPDFFGRIVKHLKESLS